MPYNIFFPVKKISHYILWLVILIFEVVKSIIWRKNIIHRIKLYFLEMNYQALSYHISKKWKIQKSIMAGVSIPMRYLKTVKMVYVQI